MPEEEKNKSSEFKVVDRRIFSEDGSVRQQAREESGDPGPAVKSVQTTAPVAAEAQQFSDQDAGEFEGVVQFLGTTAMFQLGLMQGPSGERIPADLASAQMTINMLEVLERKTRGNLTPQETRMLEDILYELRMSFLEIEKRQSKKPK